MPSRGTFAGEAPSGRIIMSGATTGFEMLEQALANELILESTSEGGPPTDIDPKFCKLYRHPPHNDAEYYQGQCSSLEGPDTHSDSLEEWVHTHPSGAILMRISLVTWGTTTDFLALFSVRMESTISGRFVDGKAEHLQERTVVERRAGSAQRRIMGRPIMALQRPQNASYQSNEPVRFLLRGRRRR